MQRSPTTSAPRRLALGVALLAAVLVPTTASAQVAVGLGAGLARTTLGGGGADPFDQWEMSTTWGGSLTLPWGNGVAVETGIWWVEKGASGNADAPGTEVELEYLEVPLLVRLRVAGDESAAVHGLVGGYVATARDCTTEVAEAEDDEEIGCGGANLVHRSTDFGGMLGLGMHVQAASNAFVFADVGGSVGLVSIENGDDPDDARNVVLFVRVGLGWVIGG